MRRSTGWFRTTGGRGGPAAAPRLQCGFTMPELVATLTVAAVVTALVMPSYQYVTNSSRVSAEINALLGDLQYARAQAIKEGQPVTVCASADGLTCSGVATWKQGWIVFSDPNANTVVDAGEPIRRWQKPFAGTDTLDGGGLSALSFNRDGFPMALAGTTTMTLHDLTATPRWTRCVQVTRVGRLVTELSGVGACL